MNDLFPEPLPDGITLLPRQADAVALLPLIDAIAAVSPPRHLTVPGGGSMSVAMTNCGMLGWVSDRGGYRYDRIDPLTGRPWPAMPAAFTELAAGAAAQAGFAGFMPDACLINSYAPGARMGLHQDRDERDFAWPIVSVSLGLDAVFLIGGTRRTDPTRALVLADGAVLVFGGPARRMYHGVRPLKAGHHPLLGARRLNLTFRKAG